MKIINITIIGANGKMGKTLIKRISNYKKLKLESLIDLKVKKKIKGLKIKNNNINAFKKTDIIIDFSNPKSLLRTLQIAKKLKKKNCNWHNRIY